MRLFQGVVFINGFNLGRFWPAVGPQVTLYLPGYLLRRHPVPNYLVVVETDLAPEIPTLSLVSQPVLNAPVCGAPAAAATPAAGTTATTASTASRASCC